MHPSNGLTAKGDTNLNTLLGDGFDPNPVTHANTEQGDLLSGSVTHSGEGDSGSQPVEPLLDLADEPRGEPNAQVQDSVTDNTYGEEDSSANPLVEGQADITSTAGETDSPAGEPYTQDTTTVDPGSNLAGGLEVTVDIPEINAADLPASASVTNPVAGAKGELAD